MLAFPPTQIGYPQHRRVFRFLQISRRALRVTNSPTLEVIASPVASFIVLRKRKLKHQPSGAFFKSNKWQDLCVCSWSSPRRSQMARSTHFKLGWPFFTLRHMNELSAAGQAQKGATDQIFTFQGKTQKGAKRPDLYI